MHKEVLTARQTELLPIIKSFKREFYLVEGTAIALYIGHRRSIDFDLFKKTTINHKNILSKLNKFPYPYIITRKVPEQLNLTLNEVKITFFEYPFLINASCEFEKSLRLPELLDLAAMKAYALGRRSKWKDYVNLYFLLKDHFSIHQISARASQIFESLFLEKLFRSQLSYFADIDYSESVEFLAPSIPEKEIRDFLIEKAIDLE
jgi:hypothetical protein